METTTSKQDMTRLLRRAQRFQLKTKYSVMINSYHDERGLWFVINVEVKGVWLHEAIYQWHSLDENAFRLDHLLNNI